MVLKLIDTITQVKYAGFTDDALIYLDRSGNVVSKNGNDVHVIAGDEEFKSKCRFTFVLPMKKTCRYIKKGSWSANWKGRFHPIHFFNNGDWVGVLKGTGRCIVFQTGCRPECSTL